MKVLVCGSRDFEDCYAVAVVLCGLRNLMGDDPELVIIEGGATGADTLAKMWAKEWGHTVEEYAADWIRQFNTAGPFRNLQMLNDGKPDVVVAFVNKPLEASRGTHHMVQAARGAGIKTYVVEAR